MSRLPNYRKNSLQGMQDYLRDLKRQQNRSQFSPRILASDGTGGMTRDQAIGNDALSGAIEPWSGVIGTSGFVVTHDWAVVSTLNAPVPDGYTQALITLASAMSNSRNTTNQTDWLYVGSQVNAERDGVRAGSYVTSADISPGEYGTAIDQDAGLFVNLSGSFTIDLRVSSEIGAWDSDIGNSANLTISLLFLR